ncbi:hypothetical protein VQL36_09535 [Chengkuizengella sp. SCS-71B]|uniref:hypothetical protein n=1 Tax=Chengkuizengella sp. SCS-71B TaxID=3115290 RepID=UPI0032C225DF
MEYLQYLFYYIDRLSNIFISFFQEGIWVIGFMFLLNKTFESKRLINISKVVTIIVLIFLFLDLIIMRL